MIQPNELRIGSIVFAYPFRIIRVSEINANGVLNQGDETEEPFIFEDLEGIPLTPEIFEKSGFELFESERKYWCHGSYMFVKGEKGYDVIDDHNWDEIAEPIEYVHQLQNLIFCLTGAEINIIL